MHAIAHCVQGLDGVPERLTGGVAATVNDKEPQFRDIDELDLPPSHGVQGVDQRVTRAPPVIEPRPISDGSPES